MSTRNHTGVGWLITASIIGGSAFGLSTPPAHADITDVYADLQANSVPIAAWDGVPSEGARVCQLLRDEPTAMVVQALAKADGLPADVASTVVGIYTHDLCPDVIPSPWVKGLVA